MEFVLFMTGLAWLLPRYLSFLVLVLQGSPVLFSCSMSWVGFLDFEIPWEVASDLGYVEEGMEALAVRIGILLVVFALATWMVARRLSTTRSYGMVAHPPTSEAPTEAVIAKPLKCIGRTAIALTTFAQVASSIWMGSGSMRW